MPKLHSSKHIISVLERNGFVFVSQKGSHAKYRKIGKEKIVVIVPISKEIPRGTFSSILRQSNLPKEIFK